MYSREVVDVEWDLLATGGRLSDEGWRQREVACQAVLDLTPQTPRKEVLHHHMIIKLQLIAELPQEREVQANHTLNPLFWFAAFVGFILLTAPYLIYEPSGLNLILPSVYGAFTGFILFIIFAFSDPFAAPAGPEPLAFERLLKTGIGAGG